MATPDFFGVSIGRIPTSATLGAPTERAQFAAGGVTFK
jgi:hypothetical protein